MLLRPAHSVTFLQLSCAFVIYMGSQHMAKRWSLSRPSGAQYTGHF